jgi:hypothetical protein
LSAKLLDSLINDGVVVVVVLIHEFSQELADRGRSHVHR